MGRKEKAGGSSSQRWQLGSSRLKAAFLSSKSVAVIKQWGFFMLKEESQTEGAFKGKPVQRNSNAVALMHMLKIKEAQRSGV